MLLRHRREGEVRLRHRQIHVMGNLGGGPVRVHDLGSVPRRDLCRLLAGPIGNGNVQLVVSGYLCWNKAEPIT